MVQTHTTLQQAPEQPRWRRILGATGLVLAAVMSVFNLINGITSLIDPTIGQQEGTAPQPVWISGLLVGFGAVTLLALVPAWRGRRPAVWVVIVSRLLESWSALVLPFLPGVPEGMWPFVIALVIGGTIVAGLVALRLDPRSSVDPCTRSPSR